MKSIKQTLSILMIVLVFLNLFIVSVDASESVIKDEFRKLEVESYGSIFYYYYHIPQIELAGDVDTEMIEGIYNLGIISYLGDKNRMLDGEVGFGNLSYSCGQKEHILSILTLSDSSETPHKNYVAYNISIETGKEVSQGEILSVYGLSEEEFYKKAKSSMETFFREKYKDLYERGDWIIELDARLDFTLSDKNMKNIVAYVDANGDLCATAWIGSVAGADAYQHIVNVTGKNDPTEPIFADKALPNFAIKSNSKISEIEKNDDVEGSNRGDDIEVPNDENISHSSSSLFDKKSLLFIGLGMFVFVTLLAKSRRKNCS